MKSNALSAVLFVAAATLSSCAGMVEKIKDHNDRIAARQEAQRLANEEKGISGSVAHEETSKPRSSVEQQPTAKRHAPYKGTVTVALFVSFRGKLWQEGMQERAADGVREKLAAHGQFDLVPVERMRILGNAKQPNMSSSAWVDKVRAKFGKNGPQILLHVTLTSEEALGKNKKTGKIEKYPKFTGETSYRHIKRNASAKFSKSGHVFANGNVVRDIVAEFHERALTEIMPAN